MNIEKIVIQKLSDAMDDSAKMDAENINQEMDIIMDLGLDSMTMVSALSEICDELQIDLLALDVEKLSEMKTVGDLIKIIENV